MTRGRKVCGAAVMFSALLFLSACDSTGPDGPDGPGATEYGWQRGARRQAPAAASGSLRYDYSESQEQLLSAGSRLLDLLGARFLLITRGSFGMCLFDGEGMVQIPVHGTDQVADQLLLGGHLMGERLEFTGVVDIPVGLGEGCGDAPGAEKGQCGEQTETGEVRVDVARRPVDRGKTDAEVIATFPANLRADNVAIVLHPEGTDLGGDD